MSKYLDKNGLLFYHTSIKSIFVEQVSGKGLSTEDYTTAEKTKLSGIETGANKTTVDSALSGSSTNPVQNSVIKTALDGKVDTVSGKGLSTEDYTTAEKTKLAGIDTGANKTTVDSALSDSSENPVQNKVVKAALDGKVSTVSGKGLSTEDYTTAEKTKLSGIEAQANKTTVDSALSSSSENPVQNKVIKSALDGKVDVVSGKGLSTEDYTTAEKTKLAAFQDASNYALKTDITSVYKYRGSVATYSDLPSTSLTVGDVYNVEADDMNYAWTGTAWDPLGGSFTVTAITNQEISDIINGTTT